MRKLSPQSPRRRAKASFVINQSSKWDKKLSQKVIDSSSRRLSEPADKFKKIQANSKVESGTFAINFFKKNPHLKDESRPEDKIKKFDQLLSSNCLDSSERLKILIQRKMLISLVYGQLSSEYLESATSLGSYYNSMHRTTSAIRTLEEAVEVDGSVSNSMEESMKIRIELSEAYLSLPCAKKSELVRNTNKALNTIKPYSDIVTDDPKTNYKKSHIFGKIAFRKGNYNESMERYNEALAFLEDINNGIETAETANLYFEIGKVCSKENLSKTAGDYYQKAYDIFINLNMPKQASVLEPLLPTGEEFDLVYGSENEEELADPNQDSNYQNDSAFESRSSAYKKGESENENSNDNLRPMKFYLGRSNQRSNIIAQQEDRIANSNSISENILGSFEKYNKNQIKNDSESKGSSENDSESQKSNENDSENKSSSETDSNDSKSTENMSENKSSSEIDSEYRKPAENMSEYKNGDTNELLSENNDGVNESDITESGTESEKTEFKANRPEQINYKVEIEEEDNEEEDN